MVVEKGGSHMASEKRQLVADGNLHEFHLNNDLKMRYKIKNGVLQFRYLVNGKTTYTRWGKKVRFNVIHLDMSKEVEKVNEIIFGITCEKITDKAGGLPQRYEDFSEMSLHLLASELHQLFENEQTSPHRVYSITMRDRGIGKLTESFT